MESATFFSESAGFFLHNSHLNILNISNEREQISRQIYDLICMRKDYTLSNDRINSLVSYILHTVREQHSNPIVKVTCKSTFLD